MNHQYQGVSWLATKCFELLCGSHFLERGLDFDTTEENGQFKTFLVEVKCQQAYRLMQEVFRMENS